MDGLSKSRAEIEEIDKEIARLFERRMDCVCEIAKIKAENKLPILDEEREQALFKKNVALLKNSTYMKVYRPFFCGMTESSRLLQKSLAKEQSDFFPFENAPYPIMLREGSLKAAADFFKLKSKVLIVTDSGIPKEYISCLKKQFQSSVVFVFEQGEQSKNGNTVLEICRALFENGFERNDALIALGGGVVGDCAGFAASIYMRGINFYNIPTTLLSQIDSSIGGKTAIDFSGCKNLIGAFYNPKAVLIDPALLASLPKRQKLNGFAESLKIGITSDRELFEIFEQNLQDEKLNEIILRSIKAKLSVVLKDEKEAGLRRVLNFGHTIGHAIEAFENGRLLHGECVALGLIPMCSDEIKPRVKKALCNLSLETEYDYKNEKLLQFIIHDKKLNGNEICVVKSEEIGTFKFELVKPADLLS